MMKLYWSPRSPFVRKVMVAAHELGLSEKIECLYALTDMKKPNLEVMAANPLGKIPALALENGEILHDSRVILEYLNALAGDALMPQTWQDKTNLSMIDGLLEILVLWRNEKFLPPEQQTREWLVSFETKTRSVLARFEASVPQKVDAIAISLGCALAYLDFRFQEVAWRETNPHLAKWFSKFELRNSMIATKARE